MFRELLYGAEQSSRSSKIFSCCIGFPSEVLGEGSKKPTNWCDASSGIEPARLTLDRQRLPLCPDAEGCDMHGQGAMNVVSSCQAPSTFLRMHCWGVSEVVGEDSSLRREKVLDIPTSCLTGIEPARITLDRKNLSLCLDAGGCAVDAQAAVIWSGTVVTDLLGLAIEPGNFRSLLSRLLFLDTDPLSYMTAVLLLHNPACLQRTCCTCRSGYDCDPLPQGGTLSLNC